jgi:hypothetical protein
MNHIKLIKKLNFPNQNIREMFFLNSTFSNSLIIENTLGKKTNYNLNIEIFIPLYTNNLTDH